MRPYNLGGLGLRFDPLGLLDTATLGPRCTGSRQRRVLQLTTQVIAVRQGELAMNTSDASSNRSIRGEPQARIRVVADDAADHVARRGALVRGIKGWRP
jgi:hypothetical protein